MSEYAKSLRAASKTWSSAYLQYKTGKNREGYIAYSFVEDDDDKWFYQNALQELRGICYVSCGGKDQVIAVFNKLKEEDSSDGNLFFVDRDTETLPSNNSDEVLRTELYSWESYVSRPSYVGRFLETRIDPNLNPADVNKVVESWVSSLENFRRLLAEHAALCRTALVAQKSFGLGEFRVATAQEHAEFIIGPSETDKTLPSRYFEKALAEGIEESAIERRKRIFIGIDVQKFCHGKLVFNLLRHFVANLLRKMRRQIRGSYNSPLDWVKSMPWNNEELEFIRTYARNRLTKAGPVVAL